MYDPAEVRAEIAKHVGIVSYRTYLAEANAYAKGLATERKKLHYRLRAVEKLLVRNARKMGKFDALLAALDEQVRRQIISRKVAETRKQIFG